MNYYFIFSAILIILYIVNIVRKGKFSVTESIHWIFASLVCLILAIWPNIIIFVAKLVGVVYAPSLLFVLALLFLLFIGFRNSRRIAEQQEKIIALEQEIALLKSKLK